MFGRPAKIGAAVQIKQRWAAASPGPFAGNAADSLGAKSAMGVRYGQLSPNARPASLQRGRRATRALYAAANDSGVRSDKFCMLGASLFWLRRNLSVAFPT